MINISLYISRIIAVLNIAGLFMPLTKNIHKGMIDKQGDWWMGYDLILVGSIYLVGIPFLIALAAEIAASLIDKINFASFTIFIIIWVHLVMYLIWILSEINLSEMMFGIFFMVIPPFLFILPIIHRYNSKPSSNQTLNRTA